MMDSSNLKYANGPKALVDQLAEVFNDPNFGYTYALLGYVDGHIIYEKYEGRLPSLSGDGERVSATSLLLSWSVAKSFVNLILGVMIYDGLIELEDKIAPGLFPFGDERNEISVKNLLEMRDGLEFFENYEDTKNSDVIEMLFGRGQVDVAAYVANKPLIHPPGEVYNYSSGTTCLLCWQIKSKLGDKDNFTTWLKNRIFIPSGVSSFKLRFDDKSTFIGSTYLYGTLQDYLRFALIYLKSYVGESEKIIPRSWVEFSLVPTAIDPIDNETFSRHFWIPSGQGSVLWARGYMGQTILIDLESNAVLLRFGNTDEPKTALLNEKLYEILLSMRNI